MKRLVLLVCCIFLATAPSFAQVSFGVHGNALNFNTEGYANDVYGRGLGGGIHLDFGTPIIGIRISGDYMFLNPDQNKYRAAASAISPALGQNLTIDGGRMDIWSANANAKLVLIPLGIVHIYGTGGIGLASIKFQAATVTATIPGLPPVQETISDPGALLGLDKQTKMTTNVGAGVDFALGGITLFGELKVNWIFTDPNTSSQVPVGTVGITF